MSSRVTIYVAVISSRVAMHADISNNVSVCARHVVGCHVVWDVAIYMFCVFVDRRDAEDKRLPKKSVPSNTLQSIVINEHRDYCSLHLQNVMMRSSKSKSVSQKRVCHRIPCSQIKVINEHRDYCSQHLRNLMMTIFKIEKKYFSNTI